MIRNHILGLPVIAIAFSLGVLQALFAARFGALTAFVAILLIPICVFVAASALSQLFELISKLRDRLTWWHALCMMLFISDLVFRIRTSETIEQAPVDAWALYRLILVGIVAVVLFIRLTLRQTPWLDSLFRGFPGVLSAYAVVCVISTAWSVYPVWTFYRSIEYWIDVALLAAIVSTISSASQYKTFLDWTWTLYFMTLISVWVGLIIWPSKALEPSLGLIGFDLNGVVPDIHYNTVGEIGAVLAAIALARLLSYPRGTSRRAAYTLILSAGSLTLFFSQARSAIAGFLVAVILILLLSGRRKLLLSALLACIGLVPFGGVFVTYFLRGQDPEMFASLSGRVDWWEFGWQQLMKSPLTGLGAYTSRFAVLAAIGQSETSAIHSTYVEIIVGTSFWGLVPALVALIGTWWVLIISLRNYPRNSPERQIAIEAIAVLAILTVRSIFTTEFIQHPSLAFLLILGYAELLRRQRRQASLPSRVLRSQPQLSLESSGG